MSGPQDCDRVPIGAALVLDRGARSTTRVRRIYSDGRIAKVGEGRSIDDLGSWSRSSLYRLGGGNKLKQMLMLSEGRARLRRLNQRVQKEFRKYHGWMALKPANVAPVTWMTRWRDDPNFVRSHLANEAKKKRADRRAAKALELQLLGKGQQEIAAAVGIRSTRGVRKLLKRRSGTTVKRIVPRRATGTTVAALVPRGVVVQARSSKTTSEPAP